MNALDLFKRLPHLNDDKKVIEDWGYTPNLYHFDTRWHVSWMHCDDGYAFIDFDGETAEEAIQKAFDWCVELKIVNSKEMKNKFILLEATCSHCHKTFKFSVDITKYEQWRDGKLPIQDAFPELTPGERELLLSGLCGECFDIVFGDDELF